MAYHDEHECSISVPHVHVEDYGAVGDGKTDDTEALQRAIIAAALDGGAVVFGERNYRIGKSLEAT